MAELYRGIDRRRAPADDLRDDLERCIDDVGRGGLRRDRRRPDHCPSRRDLGLHTVSVLVPGLLPIDFGWQRQRALHSPRLARALARRASRPRSAPDELHRLRTPSPSPTPRLNRPRSPNRKSAHHGLRSRIRRATILHRGRVPMEPDRLHPELGGPAEEVEVLPGRRGLPAPGAGHLARPPPCRKHCSATPNPARSRWPPSAGCSWTPTALLGRRLGIQANTDLGRAPALHRTPTGPAGRRPAAGSTRSASISISGADGPLTPGRLPLLGSPTTACRPARPAMCPTRSRSALDLPRSPGTDQFLLVGVKYWQNAFKYNSFSFHAVSMDVGAALEAMRLWAGAHGLPLQPALWFDEPRLAELLGVRGEQEGIFAVIPLAWDAGDRAGTASPNRGSTSTQTTGPRSGTAIRSPPGRCSASTRCAACRRRPPSAARPDRRRPRCSRPLPCPPAPTARAARCRHRFHSRWTSGRPCGDGGAASDASRRRGRCRPSSWPPRSPPRRPPPRPPTSPRPARRW